MYKKTIIDKVLKRLDTLTSGQLTLITPDGKSRIFGGRADGEVVTLQIKDWNVISNLVVKGDVGFADDYRQGKWRTDNLVALMTLGLVNRSALDSLITGSKIARMFTALSYMFKANTLKGSRKNIHAHYDLGNDFYKLWLDPTMTYSSGIYHNPSDSLTTAQHNKYDRILDKMQTKSGSVLEIGCGWGGFAERAMQYGDYDIKGITLSTEQLAYANHRLSAYNTVQMVLEDYRVQQAKFDRIVSIEMFEAVGERFWKMYFSKISSLLYKNGRAVIQTITINDNDFSRYRRGGDFIRSYIFPGGMLPSPTIFQQKAEQVGLKCENVFAFGQDYVRTLQAWLDTFDSQIDSVKSLGFDDGFIRLWRLYLAGCIAGFKTGRTDVMQVELVHI